MKFRNLYLLALLPLFLSSCFEIEETYNLQENGTYTTEYDVNMGRMIDLLESLDADMGVEIGDLKKVDTVINYNSLFSDSIKKYTEAKKIALFQNTNLQLKMDVTNRVFLAKVKSHGNSITELHSFLENYDDFLNLGEEKIMNSFSSNNPDEDDYKSNNPVLSNKDFEYIITPTSFERKLTAIAIERHKGRNKEFMEVMLSDQSMDLNIFSNLVINLPRPAKSMDNKNATLSNDKKQFSLKVNVIKAAGNPELLNFKITY